MASFFGKMVIIMKDTGKQGNKTDMAHTFGKMEIVMRVYLFQKVINRHRKLGRPPTRRKGEANVAQWKYI